MAVKHSIALVGLVAVVCLVGCGKDSPPTETSSPSSDDATTDKPTPTAEPSSGEPAGSTVIGGVTPEEFAAAVAVPLPALPPDKINAVPAPGVDVLDAAKQNQVVVRPDLLRFRAADHPDVLMWEKGKVLVSAPAEKGSPGRNPFGFARKVDRVDQVGDEIVVTTQNAALEEIIHGDFLVTFDPEKGTEVEWDEFAAEAEWAAAYLYTTSLPTLGHFPNTLRDDAPAAQAVPPEQGGDPLFGFVASAARFVGGGFKAAGNLAVNVAGTVGGAVATAGKATGSAVVTAAKATAGAAVTAGKAIGGTFVSAANTTTSTVTSIAGSIRDKAVALYDAIMPDSFKGDAKLSPEFKFQAINLSIVKYDVKKTFNQSGKLPFEAAFSADSNLKGDFSFLPVLQVGAEIPNPFPAGNKTPPPLRIWLDVNAKLVAKFTLDLEVAASLTSAGGKAGSALEDSLNQVSDFAGSVLNDFRKEVMGNEDAKPAGNWKKTVFLSKPKMMSFMLGYVPVILTATFQVDVDCGFELKGQLSAEATLESVHDLSFRAEYTQGKGFDQKAPQYKHTPITRVSVLGGGEAAVACSVIPRINVFLYDTIGLNAGVRGSIIAEAKFESTCAPSSVHPKGELSLGLSAGVGIPVGARLQAPGSSWGGKKALDLGVELGPLEVWNTKFDLFNKTWDVPGLGYCTPTCDNKKTAAGEPETDLDCGGECPTPCGLGKKCKVNSDCTAELFCSAGTCAKSHCGDGVISGDETGIDCGGDMCDKCKAGLGCIDSTDCASNACKHASLATGTSNFLWASVGTCAEDPCGDDKRSVGECGADCGGSCPLCADGVICADGTQCASGQSNGYQCSSACENLRTDGGESDLDCGGATTCPRCAAGKACNSPSDCMAGAPLCNGGICTAAACGGFGNSCCTGQAGQAGQTCETGLACVGTSCQCPADRGIRCGEACCGAGQLCDGGQCVDPAPSCYTFPTTVRDTCGAGNCLASCRAILQAKPDSQSGVYTIQPDPQGAPFEVRCDMSLDGGGWTLVGFEPAQFPAATATSIATAKATGAMASLFAETGGPSAVATGTAAGFIGPRFSFDRGNYTHLRLKWCDPAESKNLYQIFKTSEEIFADSERAANGTIALTEFQSNDSVLNQQIPTPNAARFCRARTSTLRPGDTSWGIKGANESNFGCGCNSGSWAGVGSYYGGTGEECTKCDCYGGGWAGTAGNGVHKGGINRHNFYLWIR